MIFNTNYEKWLFLNILNLLIAKDHGKIVKPPPFLLWSITYKISTVYNFVIPYKWVLNESQDRREFTEPGKNYIRGPYDGIILKQQKD